MSNHTVTYRSLDPTTLLPVKATEASACWDIFAHLKPGTIVNSYTAHNEVLGVNIGEDRSLTIHPSERILVPTGWAVNIPVGHVMHIYSRSGLTLKKGLIVANGVGVIDSDYRHEVFVILRNTSGRWVKIQDGERIAQLAFNKTYANKFDVDVVVCSDVEWFEHGSERTGGFGSTGR